MKGSKEHPLVDDRKIRNKWKEPLIDWMEPPASRLYPRLLNSRCFIGVRGVTCYLNHTETRWEMGISIPLSMNIQVAPMSCLGIGNGNSLQYFYLENSMDWEPGGLFVSQSRTQLSTHVHACLVYCEQCWNEHGGACTFPVGFLWIYVQEWDCWNMCMTRSACPSYWLDIS